MTPTQYDIVVSFYDDTLNGGSLPFDWVHPLTGAPVVMKFNLQVEEDLAIGEIIKSDKWLINMAFEILP